MEATLLKCGHTANAHDSEGNEVCVICDCREGMEYMPSLAGRKAKCCYCSTIRDSDYNLAFFKYKGDSTSGDDELYEEWRSRYKFYLDKNVKNTSFEGLESIRKELNELRMVAENSNKNDSYYCGCRGWD